MTEKINAEKTAVLKIKKQFQAPRERLFRAFSKKEFMEQWWTRGKNKPCSFIEIDFKPGGSYRFGLKDLEAGMEYIVAGVYKEIIVNEKISFTWKWNHLPDSEESIVTFLFSDHDDGSELLLVHDNLIDPEIQKHHHEGWLGMLDSLNDLLSPMEF